MRFFFLDTETTGFGPQSAICEIAWVETDEQLNIVDRVHSLIDPQMPISAGASGVHGITNEDVADAPTLEEFLTIVKPGAFDGEIVVVAHNAAFDMKYVGPLVGSLAGVICTLKVARRVYPNNEDHKLQTLRYELNLKVAGANAHSAAGDVEVLVALIRKMMADTGLGLEGLIGLSNKPMKLVKMAFGKHKGEKLEDLPTEYVNWLLTQAKIDDDLRATLVEIFVTPGETA